MTLDNFYVEIIKTKKVIPITFANFFKFINKMESYFVNLETNSKFDFILFEKYEMRKLYFEFVRLKIRETDLNLERSSSVEYI